MLIAVKANVETESRLSMHLQDRCFSWESRQR